MNKHVYTIIGALLLLLIATASVANAQEQPQFPGKVTVTSVADTITVEGEQYAVVVALTIRETDAREQLTLDVTFPEITPDWSNEHDTMQTPAATRVELNTDGNIVTTFGSQGERLQQFRIVRHIEEVRAEYPLKLEEIRLDDSDGNSDLEGTTTCLGTTLMVWYQVNDSHLYVDNDENDALWHNKVITEPAFKLQLKGCQVDLFLNDGRTIRYMLLPWDNPDDQNAQWRFSEGEEVKYEQYLPFRLRMNGQTYACERTIYADGSFTIFCPAQGAGH